MGCWNNNGKVVCFCKGLGRIAVDLRPILGTNGMTVHHSKSRSSSRCGSGGGRSNRSTIIVKVLVLVVVAVLVVVVVVLIKMLCLTMLFERTSYNTLVS